MKTAVLDQSLSATQNGSQRSVEVDGRGQDLDRRRRLLDIVLLCAYGYYYGLRPLTSRLHTMAVSRQECTRRTQPTSTGNAGLDFLGYGTIRSASYQFTVNQAVYDPDSGELERFDAVFPTGRISWNASVPGATGLLEALLTPTATR